MSLFKRVGIKPILEAKLQDEVLRHRYLVGLLVDVDVREDDAPNRAEQAQDLPHPLVRGGVGAALQRRAVDGCRLLVNPFAHENICFEGRGMDAERGFEALRAKASEQVSQLTLLIGAFMLQGKCAFSTGKCFRMNAAMRL